jgi:hypothetical protein
VAYALANRWHVHGHASCCGRRRAGRPPAPARSRRRVRRPGWRRHRARPQYARPMSRCLGHLVSSLPPPSNSAIGPALWARRGTIRPGPGVKLEPPQPPVGRLTVPGRRHRRPRTNELDAGACRAGWYSPPGEGIGRTRLGAGSRPRRGRFRPPGPSPSRYSKVQFLVTFQDALQRFLGPSTPPRMGPRITPLTPPLMGPSTPP